MQDEVNALHELLKRDPRYPLDAYVFVREGLSFASQVLDLGRETGVAEAEPQLDPTQEDLQPIVERHLTGQELCDAIRQYALKEFGYMSRLVLKNWAITETADFGNIVYNMIEVGLMKKSPTDCLSHFTGVYDFDVVFDREFELKLSES